MENSDKITFGTNLARLRRSRRWSQRELAERLHTDHAMVTRWERGKVLPRPDTLEKLAALFEISPEELNLESPLILLKPLSDDPEFLQLFSQVHTLETRDRDALKAVMEAMLTRTRLKKMVDFPGAASA